MLTFGYFSEPIETAIRTANTVSIVADLLSEPCEREAEEEGLEKGDPNVGHHAIVTKKDVEAQEYILAMIGDRIPNALFITEEKSKKPNPRIITEEPVSWETISNAMIFGVDPVDGSSTLSENLYEFSTSIGVMDRGIHIGGAISAPAVRGGINVFGERGRGVFLEEGNKTKTYPVKVQAKTPKESMVYVGPDIMFMPHYSKFLNEFSSKVRTTNCTGSCALGLALVAAGRIGALVQPVQCPWDWFAGYPLVEESGGKFLFYAYGDGKNQRPITEKPCLIGDRPDQISYSSKYRNAAFIAGNPDLVDWLWELLLKLW